jgi:hypothetical protein
MSLSECPGHINGLKEKKEVQKCPKVAELQSLFLLLLVARSLSILPFEGGECRGGQQSSDVQLSLHLLLSR